MPTPTQYRAGFAIDVMAESPVDAAEAARLVFVRAATIATVFIVAPRLAGGSHRYGLPVEVELGPSVEGDLADWRKLTELHPDIDWPAVRLIIDATTGLCHGCGCRVLGNPAEPTEPTKPDYWRHGSAC